MQDISTIANGRSQLLSALSAEFYYGDDELYHAGEIAPDISRANLLLGSFEAWQPVELTADQLGEIMKPNFIDVNKKPQLVEFTVEKHELHAHVTDDMVAAMELYGVDRAGVERRITRQLTQKLKAMREALTINVITNSAGYEASLVDSTAHTWGGGSGTAIDDIRDAIAALELNAVADSRIVIMASPAIWQAIRAEVGDALRPQTAQQGYVGIEAAAEYFGVRGVNVNFTLGGSFAMGGNVVIASVSRDEADITLSAWKTANAGRSGSPEPSIIRYTEPAYAHRRYTLAAYHDYKVVPTGADSNGEQRMAFLYSNVSSGL